MIDAICSNTLLSSLYGTVANNDEWQQFCRRFCQHTGNPITMFGHDLDTGQSLGFVAGGWDEAWLQSYFDYYGKLNPWMDLNLATKPGQIGVSDHAMPRSDLCKTEYYNDWLRPQENIIAGAAMTCHRSDRNFVALGSACRASEADDDLLRLVDLLCFLAPHIIRTINISSTLSDGANVSARHLEASRFAVLLIHRSGRIGYRNQAAVELLRRQNGLSVKGDSLSSADENVRNQIKFCVSAISRQAFDELPSPILITTANGGLGMLHAHIFPDEGPQAFPEAVWSDPVSGALVVTDHGGLGEDYSVRRIVRAFGCSPAEARLADALVGGETLPEYGERIGLSRNTVRNQMQALLQKTDTHSQIEFVGLVARLSSPFATEPSQYNGKCVSNPFTGPSSEKDLGNTSTC